MVELPELAHREKLKAEMQYHDNLVTDKQILADPLLRFKKLTGELRTEEKIGPLKILIRRITVRRIAPEDGKLVPEFGS